MKRCRPVLTIILAVVLATGVVAAGAGGESVLRISDRQMITLDQVLAESASARYFFLAENHDEPRHHAAQLHIIKALQQSGRRLAIGLEMFATGSQDKLDQWVAGTLSLAEFKEVYARNWSVPWPLYQDIFLYARANRIPLIGLNLPREISRKVARQGFAALTPKERRQLPAGITCNVDPAYMQFIRQAFADHALKDRAFTNFCEAQLLWNRSMGRQLQTFLAKHPHYTVAVLVGIGHALKRGIPDEVTRETDRYRVILPEFTGFNRHNLTSREADYLIFFGSHQE